ncbi:hypothetical protein CLV62_13215 [Dysgonomonas alginatilytica]|uniref:Uncharacterized protein n=1 Tax=Dysgonomonas alginatilytica TaxID=1605892 RepID=A0A2V3PR01_9BACT|nr:hypothetical protein CLV62_13215 [Dysgonomonas alginatilytica]
METFYYRGAFSINTEQNTQFFMLQIVYFRSKLNNSILKSNTMNNIGNTTLSQSVIIRCISLHYTYKYF